ncbi:hypothetical protein C8J57DRAFT_1239580 [Mycena rebaudengoi]|nr:hypothetical protein C8J57DRAFT_1239580 [Mycena rebaudengoi]
MMNSSETFGNINKTPPTVNISSETQGNQRTYLKNGGPNLSPTRRRRRLEYPASKEKNSKELITAKLNTNVGNVFAKKANGKRAFRDERETRITLIAPFAKIRPLSMWQPQQR